MSDRYVSVLVAPPGRLGVCRLLYTVLSNIAFILFESNAYPGLRVRLQPAQRIQGIFQCLREKRAEFLVQNIMNLILNRMELLMNTGILKRI